MFNKKATQKEVDNLASEVQALREDLFTLSVHFTVLLNELGYSIEKKQAYYYAAKKGGPERGE